MESQERTISLKQKLVENDYSQKDNMLNSLNYGIDIKWEKLNVQIKDKQILQNCSGYALHGQTMGIMGPSGAGKTTFMAMLSKRIKQQHNMKITGNTYMNNTIYNAKDFSNNAALILQNDILLESLTVRETLMFAAKLRNIGPESQKLMKVDDIIQKLKLQRCQFTKVGGSLVKGISGGERKRVNIGVELVSDPQILLLDEPTSGLDSFTAYILMSILKNLAQNENKTIIFTIHQPSSDIFELLDRLLLLRKGQIVYQGYAKNVIQYMKDLQFNLPEYCNPADCFMDFLTIKENLRGSLFYSQIGEQLNPFKYEHYKKLQEPQILQDIETIDNNYPIVKKRERNVFWYEVKEITKRTNIDFLRNPALLVSLVIQLVILGFIVASIWWQTAVIPEAGTYDLKSLTTFLMNFGGFAFACSCGVYMNIFMTVVLTYPKEREVFLKEENSGTYRVSSYFLGKLLVNLIYVFLYPTLIFIIIFKMIGFQYSDFFQLLWVFVLSAIAGNGHGILHGSLFSDSKKSVEAANLFMLPFFIFAGFYANNSSYPVWIAWFQYIDPYKYLFEAIMTIEFNGVTFLVPEEQTQQVIKVDPLELFSLNNSLTNCYIFLILVSIGFHVIALISLKLRTKKVA